MEAAMSVILNIGTSGVTILQLNRKSPFGIASG
jgi:hypothetical protein